MQISNRFYETWQNSHFFLGFSPLIDFLKSNIQQLHTSLLIKWNLLLPWFLRTHLWVWVWKFCCDSYASLLPLPSQNSDIIFLIWPGSVSQHLGLYRWSCYLLRPKQPNGRTRESSGILIQAPVGKHLNQAEVSDLINSRVRSKNRQRSNNNRRKDWDMRDNDLAQINDLSATLFCLFLTLQNNIVSKHVVSVCFCCIPFE